MKTKLTIEKQIEYMKIDKNIKFCLCSEENAKEILEKSNYFYKIKSYSKLFETYRSGINKGKFTNLDFEKLNELSKIDFYLRKLLLNMTITIEHVLKVELLNSIAANKAENGYQIVNKYLSTNNTLKDKLIAKSNREDYSSRILKNKAINEIPVWNFVEVIDFGTFERFYKFYNNNYRISNNTTNYLWNVRQIRNACAHNDCLLVSMNRFDDRSLKNRRTVKNKPQDHIIYLRKIVDLLPREEAILKTFLMKDISIVLIVFFEVVKSKQLKKHQFKELKYWIDGRFKEHQNYFDIQRNDEREFFFSYLLIKKIVDKLYSLC